MIGPALIFLHAAAIQISPAAPFEAGKVPDAVLAEQRGGIRLPNGIDVALSIDTTTALDGQIVLQTVTKIDLGAPVTRVFAPADGQPVASAAESAAVLVGAPTVTYDRQNGIRISGGPAIPVSLSSGQAAGPQPQIAEGLQPIDPANPLTTDNGVVQRDVAGVSLQGTDIRIVHLTGEAFGSAIANSGNDRAIDTLTTLSVDLSNAGPDVLGSAMLRIESVGIDAMAMRY
jgi:hypothetical protein